MYKHSHLLKILLCLMVVAYSSRGYAERDWQSLRDGWFVQAGLDWTVQKPYGYPVKGMISNGSTIGVDASFGRWFTHEVGLRANVNWDNGIIDTKAAWLAPFNQPGVNHDRGGFLSVTGDMLLDLRNIIVGYNSHAVWNPQLIIRAGGVYNFGCNKGAPLIGAGWGNTFRINRHWGIYADLVWNGVSSGFTMDPSAATGFGAGSNMYFTAEVGATYYFRDDHSPEFMSAFPSAMKGRTFWYNWFVQFGADMTLYHPCKKNFSEVFPKGVAMGLDVALGKWFSPEIGIRGKVNLENMFVKNPKLEWVGYDPKSGKSNYEAGGCVMLYADMLVSLRHLFISDYTPSERCDLYGFGRMGLSMNRALGSCSPVVGVGVGTTVRLYKHLSLYFDTCYEGTTTEFFSGIDSWSGATGSKFNGLWDFNLGLQVNLGKYGW